MMTWKSRGGRRSPDHYPLDLDASERFTRYGTGTAIHPFPPVIGSISGILGLFDSMVMRDAIARPVYGPGSTTLPVNYQWQITVPGLTKMG
jgi:hypothetical protein